MAFTSKATHKIQRTVKVFDCDLVLINACAKRLGCSAAELIHYMCNELRKDVYLQEPGESLDLVRSNGKQLAEFNVEQKLWDCTLADGLEDKSAFRART